MKTRIEGEEMQKIERGKKIRGPRVSTPDLEASTGSARSFRTRSMTSKSG